MSTVTRRNFLEVAGAAGVLGALVACDTTTPETPADDGGEGSEAPATQPEGEGETEPEPEEPSTGSGHELDEYPLDPDGSDVEALWTSENMRDGWILATNEDGAQIGVYNEDRIIQVDGYAFRDMDGNGKLDIWEDWRLDANTRAQALVDKLTIEQILPLQTNGGVTPNADPNTQEIDETSLGYLNDGARFWLTRSTPNASNYIDCINQVNIIQAYLEGLTDWYGIPACVGADPFFINNQLAYNALAPTFNLDMIKESGKWMGKFYRRCGVRVMLGPQMDVQSHPIWTRFSGAYSEDPRYSADFGKAYIGGMQSTFDEDGNDLGWGRDSCAVMIKHYVGAGAAEGGRNDHNACAKYTVFPGHAFHAHLVPFIDGGMHIDSKTEMAASIMPNYGVAFTEDEEYGELVTGGLSKYKLDFLRENGYDGMITTDWGEFGTGGLKTVWGVEDLSIAERISMAFQAGTDQGGGEWNIEEFQNGYKQLCEDVGEDEAETIVRESGRRILKFSILLDLFDNPYESREDAKEVIESQEMKDQGWECAVASVILMKNKGNIIKERSDKPKVYVEGANDDFSEYFDVVDSPADAEMAVMFVEGPGSSLFNEGYTGSTKDPSKDDGEFTPRACQYKTYVAEYARKPSLAGDIWKEGSRFEKNEKTGREDWSYKGKTSTSNGESTLQGIIDFADKAGDTPVVLAMHQDNPFVCEEFEEYADAITMTYSTAAGNLAVAKIISGQQEPSGLLTSGMPLNMRVVEEHDEDVPRGYECHTDSEGNTYEFGFGLNWSGVIDDDRTATWKDVDVLMAPETIEV